MCDGTEPTCGSNSLCHGCQEEDAYLRKMANHGEQTLKLKRDNITLKEELKAEKQENELYVDSLDVSSAQEAKEVFEKMQKDIENLQTMNKILQESNNLYVMDSLKLRKKICGDGLEYLLEN